MLSLKTSLLTTSLMNENGVKYINIMINQSQTLTQFAL
ncbi:hypothetical protein yrohd0001_1960 [Yersinia rohdei ATCC 43380]|nr:hypothetical protein yrohd0001_1960 [Yersinia rohdei ATCC 43380]